MVVDPMESVEPRSVVQVGAVAGADGERTPSPRRGTALAVPTRNERLASFLARFAFLGAWALMIVIFWAIEPNYMSWTTFKAVLSGEQALVFLGLGLLVVLIVGEIDLSGSAILGLSATIVLVMNVLHGVNVVVASLVAVLAGVLIGVINGFIVVRLKVSPFVVTLGMSTLIVGIAMAISDLRSLSGLSDDFAEVSRTLVLGLPISFYYGLLAMLFFAYVLYRTPLGRRMQFIGANPSVARLAGVQVHRIKFLSFVFAGFISGLGGVIMVAGLGGFNASSSNVFLLPVIASVFLSTAVFDPGKFNPLGVLAAIYFLRSGVIGLQVIGLAEWVKNLFYGGVLVLAVTASTLLHQRRASV